MGVLSQQTNILSSSSNILGRIDWPFSICMSSMRSKAEMNGACLKASSRQPGYCHPTFPGVYGGIPNPTKKAGSWGIGAFVCRLSKQKTKLQFRIRLIPWLKTNRLIFSRHASMSIGSQHSTFCNRIYIVLTGFQTFIGDKQLDLAP